jgi:hypothetical protein
MARRRTGRSVIDLVAALSAVVDALEVAEADYIIVGSTAAATWGVLRGTRDVDVVATLSPAVVEKFLDALQGGDLYIPFEEARRVAREGGAFNILHTSSGGKVDVFVAGDDDGFTASRMSRRVRAEVLGIPTWVATAEDIVLAKLRWRRDSRSEVQWRDCVEIAATNRLDRDYLTSWALRLGVTADLAELLQPEP